MHSVEYNIIPNFTAAGLDLILEGELLLGPIYSWALLLAS